MCGLGFRVLGTSNRPQCCLSSLCPRVNKNCCVVAAGIRMFPTWAPPNPFQETEVLTTGTLQERYPKPNLAPVSPSEGPLILEMPISANDFLQRFNEAWNEASRGAS